MYPASSYQENLGLISNKWLTLHAAELWVDTLVAQDVIATIGGKIVVAPTTELVVDFGSGSTTMSVKHNNLVTGDRVMLQKDGKFEIVLVGNGPTYNAGPPERWNYVVTRNEDGTGANDWDAGDAVVSTGQTGSGFMEIYSQDSFNGRIFDWIYVSDGGVFGSNLNQSAAFELFPSSPAINDAIYFGFTNLNDWSNVFFYITTVYTGSPTFVYEYWNGSWSALTTTATPAFSTVGPTSLGFDGSSQSGWVTTSVNSQTAYWIRVRFSSGTMTAPPEQGLQRVHGERGHFGPTIAGYIRTGTGATQWVEHWAIGNLQGLYGMSDVFGIGLGEYASGENHMVIVGSDGGSGSPGIFMRNYTTDLASWQGSQIILGETGVGEDNILIDTSGILIREATTTMASFVGTTITLGPAGSNDRAVIDTAGVRLYGDGTLSVDLRSNGDLYLGNQAGVHYFYDASETLVQIGNTTNPTILIDAGDEFIQVDGAGAYNRTRISSDGMNMEGTSGSRLRFVETDITQSGDTGIASITGYRGAGSGEYHGEIHMPTAGASGYNQFNILLDGGTSGPDLGMEMYTNRASSSSWYWEFKNDSNSLMRFDNGEVVFNELHANRSFRVESDTRVNALTVLGSTGRVGVNRSATTYDLEVSGDLYVTSQIRVDSYLSSAPLNFSVYQLLPSGIDTNNAQVYNATIPGNGRLEGWAISAFVQSNLGGNDSNDYWRIRLYEVNGSGSAVYVTGSEVNTNGNGTNTWVREATTIDWDVTSEDLVYVEVTKQGAGANPGTLYLAGPWCWWRVTP
jgi:hypothetical protein